ncbi:MAG: Transposase [Syntrophorhabdus sp. PtaU1.Bin002]|nr:MAG: Transposase [Syntrophorhabdus sp. PtaB.Bin006]OPY73897.1 MAG: Transposase [Syntrophorhabdus sp. PtaU1.Bin002]
MRQLVVHNTREGFENLCFHADTLKNRHALKKVVFGREPTADYHKPLAEYLIRKGHTVVLVAGTAVKKNRELLDGRWDKNDIKDAANVADLISQGKCLFYEFPQPDIRGLRNLLSLKRRLKKQEQGYKVRIRNHLIAQYFPEMDSYFSYGEGPSPVKWCLNPAELAHLSFDAFARMVSSYNGGEKQRRRLADIHRKAASSYRLRDHPEHTVRSADAP